jgi:hypothetical protein
MYTAQLCRVVLGNVLILEMGIQFGNISIGMTSTACTVVGGLSETGTALICGKKKRAL